MSQILSRRLINAWAESNPTASDKPKWKHWQLGRLRGSRTSVVEQQIHYCTSRDGVSIAYATTGEGYPVVKAANWIGNLQFDLQGIWNHWLIELSSHNLFVRYDQRGCGLSDRRIQDFSFEQCVDDMESVVDSLELKRFALLGMSHGASVSIAYAVRHPDQVSHLILYGGFARGWAKIGLPPERIEELEAVAKLMRSGWGRDDPAFRQIFTSWFMPNATAEQMQAFNEYQKVSASPENAAHLYRLIGETDVQSLLPTVSVPTIVLHARGDRLIPFRNGVELASSIPGARFIPLESRNHVLLEDEHAWEEFLLEYRRFLGVKKGMTSPPLLTGISSGSPALDGLLKGYPIKSAIVVVGSSGSAKESLMYRFIHDGLVHGDACLHVTRLTTEEVLKDAKGFGIDLEAKGPLWLSSDSETKCDVNNLAGLSYSIKEVLRKKANQRIRITFDVLSSVLMINQAETVYRFLTQLFQEAKQYDAVLLATLEESMHKPEVLASMEQIFDGVIAIKMPSGGSNRRFVLEVRKMRGTPFALEMPWETDRVPH